MGLTPILAFGLAVVKFPRIALAEVDKPPAQGMRSHITALKCLGDTATQLSSTSYGDFQPSTPAFEPKKECPH